MSRSVCVHKLTNRSEFDVCSYENKKTSWNVVTRKGVLGTVWSCPNFKIVIGDDSEYKDQCV